MTVISISSILTDAEEEWTFADAVLSLVVALAVAVATLSLLGFALHVLNSNFSFSLVHATHQSWAWISILVMSVLWLGAGLVHQIRSGGGGLADREPAARVGEADGGAGGALRAMNQGRTPSRRPRANREVAG